MRFTFDPKKDQRNIAIHGVSLALAETLLWDEALVWIDDRFEYDEIRMIALAPKELVLYYVAFVDRMDEERRIVSLRKAERKEVLFYVENYQ